VKIGRKAAGLFCDSRVIQIKHWSSIMARTKTMGSSLGPNIVHPSKLNPIAAPTDFSREKVDLTNTPLFFPQGFEKIFLGIYFIILPYIAGILFLFFFIAEATPKLFLTFYEKSSFILTWAIGYEVIAGLGLLYIVKMALSFAKDSRKPQPKVKQFRRP